MIEAVINHINDTASFTFWRDKLVGLATPVKDGDKTYAYGHCTGCETNGEKVYPDSKYRSVAFWELDSPEQPGAFRDIYEADVSLLVWLDLHKLGAVTDGCTDRSMTAQVMKEIIKEVEKCKGQTGSVKVSKIEFLGAKRKDLSMFSKYTFRDDTKWFFGKYDYFGLRFRVSFSVDCSAIVYTPEEC